MEGTSTDLGESKQRSARTGRRAKKQPSLLESSSDAVDDAAEEEAMPSNMSDRNPSAPPRAAKKMSGWGEDSVKRRRGTDDIDDDRLKPQTPELEREDSDADIPVIPELEDQQPADDLSSDVAVAPTVAVNRVATYRELDHDLLRHAAFLTLDNEIDLKPLSRGLAAEFEVQEPDTPWDWDRLFTEVTSELLTEFESRSDAVEEEKPKAA